MSTTHCCFCERLPAISKRNAGTLSSCPFCQGELIVAWRSGDKYRLVHAEANPSRRRRGLQFAAFGIAAMIACAAGTAAFLQPPRNQSPSAIEVVTQAGIESVDPLPAIASSAASSEPLAASLNPEIALDFGNTKVEPWLTESVATAKAIGPLSASEPAPPARVIPLSVRAPRSEESLRKQLIDKVAEVALEEKPAEALKEGKQAQERIKQQADAIAEQTKKDADAFVKGLIAKRVDLAGLPWRQGKECQLASAATSTLHMLSQSIRIGLDTSLHGVATGNLSSRNTRQQESFKTQHPDDILRDSARFWTTVASETNKACFLPSAISTLDQMLAAENRHMRVTYVEKLSHISGAAASVALAQRAVFDLDPTVRVTAVDALRGRPADEFVSVLLAALRHPWSAAAENAADALVDLGVVEAVPMLVSLLSLPDPGQPYLQTVQGKEVPVVRELVRVNHLRNCMLCHAPSTSQQDVIRAPIPTPGVEIPNRATVYYAERSGLTMIRADVTYLKQDFSVMQPVESPGAWPTYQRYDYLVRVRRLNDVEKADFQKKHQLKEMPPRSEHKEAILHALQSLTGWDAGNSPEAWQQVLAVREWTTGR